MPAYYFTHTAPEDIARHVLSLQAAKQLATLSERPFDVELKVEGDESAFFATTSAVSLSAEKGKVVRLDADLVRGAAVGSAWPAALTAAGVT